MSAASSASARPSPSAAFSQPWRIAGGRLNKALAPVADWGEAYAKATGRYPRDAGA